MSNTKTQYSAQYNAGDRRGNVHEARRGELRAVNQVYYGWSYDELSMKPMVGGATISCQSSP